MIQILKNNIRASFFILTTLQTACGWLDKKMEITDVSSKQMLLFVSQQENPSNYQLTVQSDIDGEISIREGMNEILRVPKGNNKTTVISDEYNDTLRLEYVPINVTKGKVVIYYNF